MSYLKKAKIVCFLVFSIVCACSLAIAQGATPQTPTIPSVVHFSGQTTILDRPVSITFSIYAQEGDNSALWLETQIVNPDLDGRYTVLLGSTRPDGLPSSIFVSGEARWLGVKVEGGEEQPRTLLVSVPYALKAGDAQTLGGKPLSAFVLADGSSLGSTSTTTGTTKSSRLQALETSQAHRETTATGDSGGQNFLGKFDASTVNLVASQVFDNGTNVGVGTTSPGATLDVAGTIRSTNTSDSVNSSTGGITTLGGLGVAQTGYFGNGIVLESQSSASFVYGTSGFSTRGSSLASSAGTSVNYNGTFFNNNGTGAGDTGAQKNVSLPSWRMALGGGAAEWNGADNFSLARVASGGSFLAPAVLFKVTNVGNVGVGTSAPGEKLDVNGKIRSTDTTDSVSSITGSIYTSGGLGVLRTGYFGNGIVLESQNAGSFIFGTGGTATKGSSLASSAGTSGNYNGAFLNSNGIGAGDTGAQKNTGLPSWRMALGGGAAEWNGADNFSIARVTPGGSFTAPSILLTLNSAGNVGIGMNNPIHKLDASQSGTGVAGSAFLISTIPPSAVHGDASATSTVVTGVFGTTSSVDGYGVLGENLGSGAGSGTSAGVRGITANTTTLGTGVWGDALQTDGDNVGVFGHSASAKGTGVEGFADNLTSGSDETGVYGKALSDFGTGVFGESTSTTAASATQYPVGVYGKISTTTAVGAAGLFDVPAGGGNILIGRSYTSGSSPVFSNVFRVDNTGKVFSDGGQINSGADFAESVAVTEIRSAYQPGDVIAVDPNGTRRFEKAAKPYSTLVAGIYSTKPGVLATEHRSDDARLATVEIPLAVVGIVPCKVTNENGAIDAGDLLVSSSTAGYAMKGTDRGRMMGAVIGKALGAMHGTSGVIEVLVSLQ